MGMSLQCYVGPYLRCPNPKVDTVMERRACGNKDCEEFGKRYSVMSEQKFCSKCGTEVRDDVKVTEQWPRTDADALNTEIEERLCRFNWNSDAEDETGRNDFWVPNADGDKVTSRDCWVDAALEGVWPISDTPREILAFQDVYATEIKRFEEAYAPEKITLEWGILTAYW